MNWEFLFSTRINKGFAPLLNFPFISKDNMKVNFRPLFYPLGRLRCFFNAYVPFRLNLTTLLFCPASNVTTIKRGKRIRILLFGRNRSIRGNRGLASIIYPICEPRIRGLFTNSGMGSPMFRNSKVSTANDIRDRNFDQSFQ